MVEYALDVEGMTFAELMSPATDGASILSDMFAAYGAGLLQ